MRLHWLQKNNGEKVLQYWVGFDDKEGVFLDVPTIQEPEPEKSLAEVLRDVFLNYPVDTDYTPSWEEVAQAAEKYFREHPERLK